MPETPAMPATDSGPSQAAPLLTPSAPSSLLPAYALTIFLSATLLFQVQLIFAKHVLPFFGGAPSVWNTCMFCFQVLLLLGYIYAHVLKSRLKIHQQRSVHSVLLVASAVLLVVLWILWGTPLTPGKAWKPVPGHNPVWKILQLLGVTVAFPFFIVSTTGPLLQSWAARTKVLPSPYRLYALSNAGSLLGLLTYPFLLEWAFTIRHQAWVWSSTYLLFVAFCLAIALRLPKETTASSAPLTRSENTGVRPTAGRYALWLLFSTCSTVVLFSSTNYLCENIGAIPLLWVLPLSIYLLTFILAFDNDRWYSRRVFWPLYAASIGIVLSPHIGGHLGTPLLLIGLYCFTIFAVCSVCHGELARSKPSPEHLTSFYGIIAAGGALGGTFVILIAPQIFRGFWEFQGALLCCGLLMFGSSLVEDSTGQSEAAAWSPALVIFTAFLLPHLALLVPRLSRFPLISQEYWTIPICFVLWLLYRKAFAGESTSAPQGDAGSRSRKSALQPMVALLMVGLFAILFSSYIFARNSRLLYRERNFFGFKYVSKEPQGLALFSGNTIHGLQLADPAQVNLPTLYYSPLSGVGTLLRVYPRTFNDGHLRIGVVGMGVASLSPYARPGDYFRFYEIDPAVVLMSLGPHPIFTFLQHSLATTQIVLGDARISLERELEQGSPQHLDVLVIDAFNGDSIPVHLLTQESVALYRQHLRGPDGVLAFHLSNRYLDLAPVLRGLAEANHLAIAFIDQDGSNWVLLCANPAILQVPGLPEVTAPPTTDHRTILWTDDYSNIFKVLRSSRP
jgi:hypothetical protein